MQNVDAEHRLGTFTPHAFAEQVVDLGDIRMNYATAGDADLPALLLVPGQSESWWGYEQALPLLAEHFQAYAVDLRGQGRSTWTPGRYTLDNWGNDLVRFIDLVIGRPVIVSGNSSGGVLAAWLAAYAKPDQVRGAVLEDAPIFASEVRPACGQSISQCIGPLFAMWSKWLGDQWSIGDWKGMLAAAPKELPEWLLTGLMRMQPSRPAAEGAAPPSLDEPPQNMREYDPEWGRAFWAGTASASCDHARMMASVRAPILFTHHFRMIDSGSGALLGAVSDQQAARARDLITGAGQPVEYASFPEMAHSMHSADPELFTQTIVEWSAKLT
jgi:pimeloyl-ACP methyl ester carboxylesterase